MYILYNTYIINKEYKLYTLTQFRQNLRQAFNDADQGHEVVIERYGQKFQLVSLVKEPLPGHVFESRPNKEPAEKRASSVQAVDPKDMAKLVIKSPADVPITDEKPCKHGYPPEFCKFSKPGKPCKIK